MTKGQQPKSTVAAQAERVEKELGTIRRALRKPLDAEVQRGELTVPQFAVMRVIVRQPGISLKALSREVSLAHSTTSGIVDRLQKRGMLERRAHPEDARVACIFPTAVVNEFVREQIPALTRGPLVAALARIPAAERDQIEHALHRLRTLLESN
ncbi:MAG: MarR family winged helix-turn-helix transcriptional regulator [Acidobacteriota bacterium]